MLLTYCRTMCYVFWLVSSTSHFETHPHVCCMYRLHKAARCHNSLCITESPFLVVGAAIRELSLLRPASSQAYTKPQKPLTLNPTPETVTHTELGAITSNIEALINAIPTILCALPRFTPQKALDQHPETQALPIGP